MRISVLCLTFKLNKLVTITDDQIKNFDRTVNAHNEIDVTLVTGFF